MFGHMGTSSSGDKTGGGGNVKQVGTIATGADNVHNVFSTQFNALHQLAHYLSSGANFLGTFTFHGEAY